jgi:hypothetical protein
VPKPRFDDRMLVIRWFAADAARVARELHDDAEALRAQASQARRRAGELRAGVKARDARRTAGDALFHAARKE